MKTLFFYLCIILSVLSCKKDDIEGGKMFVSASYNIKIKENGKNISAFNNKDVQLFFKENGKEVPYYRPNYDSPYGLRVEGGTDASLNVIAFDFNKMDSLMQRSTKQEQTYHSDAVLKYFGKTIDIKTKIVYTQSYITVQDIIVNAKIAYDRIKMKQLPIEIDFNSL